MILPDPRSSRAVLIGVSDYTQMPSLPAVRNNVEALRYTLTGVASWNLPFENCIAVHDPRSPEELIDPILEAAEEATDTLLVYYAGHGMRGPNRGELRVTRAMSRPGAPHTATPYGDIRDIIIESRAFRRIVILDCCYAASALGTMAEPSDEMVEDAVTEGTYLIAAAGETEAAMAHGENGFTVFTGELLQLLKEGTSSHQAALLDLDTVFAHLDRSLRAKSRPRPRRRVRDTPGNLALAWNRGWLEWQLLESRKSSTEIFDDRGRVPDGGRLSSAAHLGGRATVVSASVPAVAHVGQGDVRGTSPAVVSASAPSLPLPAGQESQNPEVGRAAGLSADANFVLRSSRSASPVGWAPSLTSVPAGMPDGSTSGIEDKREEVDFTDLPSWWPKLIESVKNRRRFAWILLTQNARPVRYAHGVLYLEFENTGSLSTYVSADIETLLKKSLLEDFGLPCAVNVVVRGDAARDSQTVVAKVADGSEILLAVGDMVDHKTLGKGVVISVQGGGEQAKASVDFGDGKPKRLLLRYAPIGKI